MVTLRKETNRSIKIGIILIVISLIAPLVFLAVVESQHQRICDPSDTFSCTWRDTNLYATLSQALPVVVSISALLLIGSTTHLLVKSFKRPS